MVQWRGGSCDAIQEENERVRIVYLWQVARDEIKEGTYYITVLKRPICFACNFNLLNMSVWFYLRLSAESSTSSGIRIIGQVYMYISSI